MYLLFETITQETKIGGIMLIQLLSHFSPNLSRLFLNFALGVFQCCLVSSSASSLIAG